MNIIQALCLSFSVYVQTLNRKQNRLTLALIPVECFVVMSEDVEMPSLEEKKFPPLHVIYEDISDIWVNVSTVKAVLSCHSKGRPKLIFKTYYRLMQVKSIAECSKGEHSAILSTFI